MRFLFMTGLLAIVDSFMGCVSSNPQIEIKEILPIKEERPKKPKPIFHQQIETIIPVVHQGGQFELKADIYRPLQQTDPKTLIIIVPGQGNVSRQGETSTNGIDTYKNPILMSTVWAKALSDHGFFVLSYDKRSCTGQINPICLTNPQTDIEQEGIIALARDLDQVVTFALEKLQASTRNPRIVLLSTTQGAQTIALSESKKFASGIILLSPIIGDLENMWVEGLEIAARAKSGSGEGNKLINRKESMAGFFNSLKTGGFSSDSMVMGARVTFWQAWINSTKETLNQLVITKRPFLLIFSHKDPYSKTSAVKKVEREINAQKNAKIVWFSDSDRNFVIQDGVFEPARSEIIKFINAL